MKSRIEAMAEQNTETTTTDVESTYTAPGNDPKNMQEVTQYVSFPLVASAIWSSLFNDLDFDTT